MGIFIHSKRIQTLLFSRNWGKKQAFPVLTLTPSSYSSWEGQGNTRTSGEAFPVLETQQKVPSVGLAIAGLPPVPYSLFLSSMVGLGVHNLAFLLKEKVLSSTISFSRLISTWTVSTCTLVLAYGSRRHRSKTRRQRWERPGFLEANIISASFWSRDVKVSTLRQWCPGILSELLHKTVIKLNN